MKHEPDPELVEQFRLLEAKIDEAAETIVRLRLENAELRRQLDAARQSRQQALERLDDVLDKLDTVA